MNARKADDERESFSTSRTITGAIEPFGPIPPGAPEQDKASTG